MKRTILVGAVLYDPKVAVIWEIIRDFFEENGCPIDVVFYTNYEIQVDALLNAHIDIAWNSPLAWLDAQRRSRGGCRVIAMRDTDRDRVTHLVVKNDANPKTTEYLRGKVLALAAKDSPQGTLIPLGYLQRCGLEPGRDFEVKRFDVLVGKHGDHIGGELDAFRCLASGDAHASAMLDLNWQAWVSDGTIDPTRYAILATTDSFDHCVFTVCDKFAEDLEKQWLKVLFSMSYENPKHREMMDMEGLKAWLPARTSNFGCLAEAVTAQRFFEERPT